MILTTGSKKNRTLKKHQNNSGFDAGVHFKAALTAVFNVVLLLSVIFCIANARIVLNNKIDKLDQEARNLRIKIEGLQLESENLRMRREKLSSWPEISRRIERFKLNLRAPRHTQIRQLAIVPYNLRDSGETDAYSAGSRLSQR